MNRKFKRTAFIQNRIFSNIINVFTVTFVQCNSSLMNRSIDFLFFPPKKKKKILLTPNFLKGSV